MFLQNISKRKILLLIINALISILMISCVIFLYYYLPAATHQQQQMRTFMVEKENSPHYTSSKRNHGDSRSSSSIVNANVRISSARRPSPSTSEEQEQDSIDDTIYIDNDNYGDSYADNSGNYNYERLPVTAPVTIIERPIERKKISQKQQQADDDLYYENYDDTDDEDIVSSGNGKIVVNIKKPLPPTPEPPPMEPVVENVYSVSSEIVSNLNANIEDSVTTKQINKPDDFIRDTSAFSDDDSLDGAAGDEWTVETNDSKGKRLIGNNKSLVERSRQLLLCESARTGELCRMLFKGTVG